MHAHLRNGILLELGPLPQSSRELERDTALRLGSVQPSLANGLQRVGACTTAVRTGGAYLGSGQLAVVRVDQANLQTHAADQSAF